MSDRSSREIRGRLAEMRRRYTLGGLAESNLAPTWCAQLERWLADAAVLGVVEANAMVLATADPSCAPSARTVLLKGLDEHGLVFFTNLRSRKGREAAANPQASAVFPWVVLERQVVVCGRIEPLDDATSDAYFATRPRGAQVSAAASPQSEVVVSRAALEAMREVVAAAHPGPVPRPAHWGGLRLVPDSVEFWQGRDDRFHDRLRFRLDEGAWVLERLAP